MSDLKSICLTLAPSCVGALHAPHAMSAECFVLFCFVWLATLGVPVVAPGTAAGPFRRVGGMDGSRPRPIYAFHGPPSFLMNPSARMVRATLHAHGMPSTCYGMQHRPFRPSHNRCTVHWLRAGHTAIWVAFGSVAGDSIRRDLPSGLLLAPLRACQVHRFPPWGALARHACCPTAAILCGCVVATQLRTGECGAAVGGAWGA